MKRSEINALIRDAKTFFESFQFKLPPWAFWGPGDWKGKGDLEIVQNQLGWDLTDYGAGDFEKRGLILFTIAVVVVTLSDRSNAITQMAAWVYLGARVLYVPAYALGWTPWRSLIWFVGFLATLVMLIAAL